MAAAAIDDVRRKRRIEGLGGRCGLFALLLIAAVGVACLSLLWLSESKAGYLGWLLLSAVGLLFLASHRLERSHLLFFLGGMLAIWVSGFGIIEGTDGLSWSLSSGNDVRPEDPRTLAGGLFIFAIGVCLVMWSSVQHDAVPLTGLAKYLTFALAFLLVLSVGFSAWLLLFEGSGGATVSSDGALWQGEILT